MLASGCGPYDNTVRVLERIDLSPARGKRVLLKPNASREVEPETGVTTHPLVVAAAIDAFVDAGADVAVGESPITGMNAFDAFDRCGIRAVADKRNCPLIDMDKRRSVSIKIPDGMAVKTLKVCRDVLDHDIIVSIPVMKMHMHTGVTLAVKNMKGCLWRRSKVDLHMVPPLPDTNEKTLDIAIADMAGVLRPHLSIVDGSIGMEGLGPSAGKAKKMDVVLAAIDPFAADAVACTLMGVSPHDIPHLRIGSARGYGIIEIDAIDVYPDDWTGFGSPFELPPENLSVEFPGVTVLDDQSCSACQSTLLLFLKRYGDELVGNRSDPTTITIAVGKGHKTVPPDTLCIGNCTAKLKKGNPFVSGCPPVVSGILDVYTEYYKSKTKS